MQFGIGLPATIPGVKAADLLAWAQRAEKYDFASLGIIDRLVYDNYEPLITLAAAAGATRRIRLMTTILLAPLRGTAILAKQTASLDALSGGRLILGLGIGSRESDFQAAGVPFHRRGRLLEEQILGMRRVWSGKPLQDGQPPIGPAPARPGGPELLMGGRDPKALQRAGRLADGYISGGGGDPSGARENYDLVAQAWREAGRKDRPRFVASLYYVVGEAYTARAAEFIHSYYGASPYADVLVRSMPITATAIRERIKAFTDAGADEVMLWPAVTELEQVDRLAEVVSGMK
jgi:alkanesulfonate monooxygenase SsuD/methylene tetrahydromethanopterin reductase-like flavin-dependent oxidoreductase (luciferase family)